MKKLITYLMLLFILVIFILILFIPEPDDRSSYKNDKVQKRIINLEIGKFYLLELKNERDPFDKPFRDTILILDRKNGYVKWTNKKWIKDTTKYWQSSEESFIATRIIDIKKISPEK